MRPIYTSSVYRRRLGSSDRARADAMGGSSAEAIASVFSPTDSPRARRVPLDPAK